MLQNAYLVAKFRFDRAENEPRKEWCVVTDRHGRHAESNRGASVRVGRNTEADGCGYMEDRRPSSNMDPYVVTSLIAKNIILG